MSAHRTTIQGGMTARPCARRVFDAVCLSALCGVALFATVAAAQPPQGDGPLSRHYTTREEANAAAERLRARGAEVRIEEVTEFRPGSLYHVQLRGFSRWADAQRVSNTLRQQGIDAMVFSLPADRSYAVSAGIFASAENADQMALRVLVAGYREVYTIRLSEEVVVYRLVQGPFSETPAASRTEPRDTVLVFGPSSSAEAAALSAGASLRGAGPPRVSGGLRDIRLEGGWLTESDSEVDTSSYLHGSVYARWLSQGPWEAYASARVFAWQQGGDPDFTRAELDYGDTWLRYRGDRLRLTAGAQTVLWGRADEMPPTDRLSVQDVTRFALDDLADRRRSVPALRMEGFHGDFKADLLWVPRFRAAELPHRDSIWHPVNRQRGDLIGIQPDPLLSALVMAGGFRDDDEGDGGAGLRLSRAGQGVDYAVSVQRTRHSLPYYELDPAVRAALLADPADPVAAAAAGDPSGTFTGRHPWTTVIGADLGLVSGAVTWRLEAAWLSDVPVTTRDLRMETVEAVDWAAGLEFYPGDADTRATLQLTARKLLDAPDILDRDEIYLLGGELEALFANYRWRGRIRFSVGLDERDVYVNPELAFIAREPHEFYLGYHYMDGAAITPGGFFQDNNLLAAGWRARY